MPVVGPVFIIALIGPSLGEAQTAACPIESRSRITLNSNDCSDLLNAFSFPTEPAQPRPRDTDSLTVTAQQLRHVPPAKALTEHKKAEKAFAQNRTKEAMGYLEDAIRIDPEFVRARNDLAALHLLMEDPYPAIEQLNEAIKFDPHFPLLFMNLAIGYIESGKFDDSERAAREAASLDRTGTLPRYLLAVSLHYQKKFTDEALQCAMQTSDKYPAAHLFAARIFIERNNFEPARVEIRAYLSSNRQAREFAITANSWLDFMASHEQKTAAVIP